VGRLLIPALCATLLGWVRLAVCHEFEFGMDLRAVASDGTQSRLDGGLGKLRYDEDHDGLRLGLLRLGYRGELGDYVHLNAEAFAYGDHNHQPIDLTQAYAELRPLPHSGWRSRLKLGAFYPDISLENRMRGWLSPYTLSFSAINTWIGAELRTIGAEYNLDWLGLQNGHDFEFSLNAAAFGWNDTAGTVLATRGWGLDDRQTTLFGHFGARDQAPLSERILFYNNFDHRAGYYAGVSAGYREVLQLKVLHYDNRADPSTYEENIEDSAWLTYFDSLGARWTPNANWTVISQWLHGRTFVDAPPSNSFSFNSSFLLASWKHGANRLSARYDRFAEQQTRSNFFFYLNDDGHAWTLAYQRDINEHWNVVLEGLDVTSTTSGRSSIGLPVAAREKQLQLAVRFEL
jgi:hypothetical protein